MKTTKFLTGALALGAALTFAPTNASAADWIIKEDSAEKRPWELGILVGIPYCCDGYFSLDPGVLLGIPIVDKGFVPINDSFYLEFGAWTHMGFADPFQFSVSPFGGVRWNFHLMEVWDAYGALRAGLTIGEILDPYIYGVAGTTWKFSEKIGLRGELGGGYGGGSLSVGIDIDF